MKIEKKWTERFLIEITLLHLHHGEYTLVTHTRLSKGLFFLPEKPSWDEIDYNFPVKAQGKY